MSPQHTPHSRRSIQNEQRTGEENTTEASMITGGEASRRDAREKLEVSNLEFVAWMVPKKEQADSERTLSLSSTRDVMSLSPEWPVPYLLQVVRNEEDVVSLSLLDILHNSIQLNLFMLDDAQEESTALLGGSTRIDPEFRGYGVKPSSLSADWVGSRAAPWLGEEILRVF